MIIYISYSPYLSPFCKDKTAKTLHTSLSCPYSLDNTLRPNTKGFIINNCKGVK